MARHRHPASGEPRCSATAARTTFRPAKHAHRLIPAQLKQLALELGHRLPRQIREPTGKRGGGIVAVLLREPRVAAHVGEQECADIAPGGQGRRLARHRVLTHDPSSLYDPRAPPAG